MPIDQTIPELKKRYRLDTETGKIFWKISYPHTSVKAGAVAGHYKAGQFCVTCRGQDFPARRVAWLLHHGEWPTGHVWLRDSDPENLRPANMVLRREMTRERNTRLCAHCGNPGLHKDARYATKFCSPECRTACADARRAAQTHRTCSRCKQSRELAAFSGHSAVCDRCRPALQRIRYLARNYKMRVEDVERLMQAQNYACAICKQAPETGPKIDHDHKTGAVRGILCGPCNTGLGHFRDDTATLSAAIAYLAHHAPKLTVP